MLRILQVCSNYGILACIFALGIRHRFVDSTAPDYLPNCHAKYYPVFWYTCLILIALFQLLSVSFLLMLAVKRMKASRWELIAFFSGLVLLVAGIYDAGFRRLLEWLLSDCLDYGLI